MRLKVPKRKPKANRKNGEESGFIKDTAFCRLAESAGVNHQKAGATSDVHFDNFKRVMKQEEHPEPPTPGVKTWHLSKTYFTPCQKVAWEGSIWLNGWWLRVTNRNRIANGASGVNKARRTCTVIANKGRWQPEFLHYFSPRWRIDTRRPVLRSRAQGRR